MLTTPFRQDIDRHSLCFLAVANIVQIVINLEEPLFHIAAPNTDGGEGSQQGDGYLV